MLDQYEGADRCLAVPRREHLSEVAQAVVDRIEDGSWDVTTLVTQLAEAAEGRHLMLWSSDTTQQAGWEAVRAAGIVDDDSLLHRAAQPGWQQARPVRFGRRRHHEPAGRERHRGRPARAPAQRRPGSAAAVRRRVRSRTRSAVRKGSTRACSSCNLPAWAREAQITGIGERVASGPDGDSQVVAAYTELERGQEVDATISFVLPVGADTLRIEPSARIPTVTWSDGDQRWNDHESRRNSVVTGQDT